MAIKINVAPEKYLEVAEALKSVAAIRASGLSLSAESASTLKSALQEIASDIDSCSAVNSGSNEECRFAIKDQDGSVTFSQSSSALCSKGTVAGVLGQCGKDLLVSLHSGHGMTVPWHRIKHVILHD